MEAAGFNLQDYTFYAVGSAEELPAGERWLLEIGKFPIVVFRVGNNYYAIGDICTHDDGPLGDGDLEAFEIICPRHGGRFDIRSGKATGLPAVIDTPWYPARVVDGSLEIGVPRK